MTSQDQTLSPAAVVVGLTLNGLGVSRSLGRAGVSVIGICKDPKLHTARTRYVKRRVACEDTGGQPLVDLLLRLGRESPGRRPLFLTEDPQVRAVSESREVLDPYYLIALPPAATVQDLLSKTAFFQLAKGNGFDVPAHDICRNPDDLRERSRQIGFPCIVKPEQNDPEFIARFERTVFLCKAPSDIEFIGNNYAFRAPVLVQEWVPGGDGDIYFVLHYFNRNSEPLASFGGRKIRQLPPRAGHTASARPAVIPEAVQISESFFRSVGAVGLCSMEFKRPPGIDRFAMIEPTVGRTDWQEAVADLNGTPIPLMAYNDLVGRSQSACGFKRSKSLAWVELEEDFRSAWYYRRCGELTLCGWLRSIWPFGPAVAALDDPLPGLVSVASLLARGARKSVRLLLRLVGVKAAGKRGVFSR